LESRELMHGGQAVVPATAVVHALGPAPAIPTGAIQQALADSFAARSTAGQTIPTRDGAIFLPSGLVPGRNYPLVVAFGYNGDPEVPFEVWRTQGREAKWIVYASRNYANAVLHGGLASSESVAGRVKAQVDALSGVLPIDRGRILLTGMSGGANFAEFMNLRYPGYAAGIIINSGRVPSQLFRDAPTPGFLTIPSASDFAGSRRVAVFLASPTDPDFYGISQANARTLERLGWQTLFLSFPGGHRNAPPAIYRQAIAWIKSRPSWATTP